MNTVTALASIVLKELYRRKDFYVLFVLTVVITLAMWAVRFFNDPGIVRHVKEICLLLIWLSGVVIALTMTARQIPAERESRTIFPLLAKPVTRAQVILGKFLGCWLAIGLCLLVFYTFLFCLSGSREGTWPALNYFQGFWLQWCALAVVIAIVLLGSVLFTSPAENVTICFFLVLGMLWIGGHLKDIAFSRPEPLRSVIYSVYFVIPHLEWYDIRDLIVYNKPLVPWGPFLLVTVYAAVYAALFLFVTWLVFRRKALTA